MNKNKIIILGLIISILLAVSAQFFSAVDPDGLEKTLAKIKNPKMEETTINTPMSNYKLPFMGGPFSGALAGIIGILIVFLMVYGVGLVIKKRKNNRKHKSSSSHK